jgi:hypothetical protein
MSCSTQDFGSDRNLAGLQDRPLRSSAPEASGNPSLTQLSVRSPFSVALGGTAVRPWSSRADPDHRASLITLFYSTSFLPLSSFLLTLSAALPLISSHHLTSSLTCPSLNVKTNAPRLTPADLVDQTQAALGPKPLKFRPLDENASFHHHTG